MAKGSPLSLSTLDAFIASAGFPVRSETLERAWTVAIDGKTSTRFHERARRTLEGRARGGDAVTILVTLRAKPDAADELEQAAIEFVESSLGLRGILSSTLYRSSTDRRTLILVERFADQDAFSRHMASDYFHRFQVAQAPLLSEPVTATFLEPVRE